MLKSRPAVPPNIAKRVREDMAVAAAQSYVRSQHITIQQTRWSAKQAAHKSGKIKERDEKKVNDEILLANEELKLSRRTRIYDLYINEMKNWEKELKNNGKAWIAENEWV